MANDLAEPKFSIRSHVLCSLSCNGCKARLQAFDDLMRRNAITAVHGGVDSVLGAALESVFVRV